MPSSTSTVPSKLIPNPASLLNSATTILLAGYSCTHAAVIESMLGVGVGVVSFELLNSLSPLPFSWPKILESIVVWDSSSMSI